jgi:anti-sigma factor RsiW
MYMLILKNAAYHAEMRNSNNRALARQAHDAVAEPVDHNDFIANGLCAILTYVAPHKALAKQKRWMRRFCRKPATMTVREYTNSLRRINERELHWLPPFAPDQLLTNDELVDIVLHRVP